MTDTLFNLDDVQPVDCRYPHHEASTGYRYGCRCRRCTAGKQQGPPPECTTVGCNQLRVKGRRVCPAHLPQCKATGCDNPRRNVQAAKYCEEHATSINYQSLGRQTLVNGGECWLCRAPLPPRRRTNIKRPLCYNHAHLARMLDGWVRHGVSRELAGEWVRHGVCWICGDDLTRRLTKQRRAAASPEIVHVDHDHKCCPGRFSCGRCVRGLTHPECNQAISWIEQLLDRVGRDQCHRVIDRIALPPHRMP